MHVVYRQNSFWNQPVLRVNNETRNYARSQYDSKQKENSETPKISVIGIDKIFDSNTHWIVRTVWLILLVTMTSLCTWQLSKCIVHYFNYPVIKQTDVIPSDLVHFPAVQVCPGVFRNLQHVFLMDELEICSDGGITCWVSDPFQKLFAEVLPKFDKNLIVEEFMSIISQNIKLYKMCGEKDKSNCNTDGAEWSGENKTISTSAGRCTLFDTAEDIPFRGPFTFLKIRIKLPLFEFISKKLKQEMAKSSNKSRINLIKQSLETIQVGAVISVQDTFQSDTHHLYIFNSQDIYTGFETHLQLHQKQFTYINRSNHYCDTQEQFLNCINECIERNLSTTCSPLYYHVKGKEKCPWTFEYLQLEIANFKTYNSLNLSHCKCPNICDEITYTMYPNVITKLEDDSSMIIKIYFADNNIEKISEKLSYNFTACLSDIGGNLGFFLGFCTLTIMEVIECAITNFLTYKNEHRKVVKILKPKKKRHFRDIFY